MTSTLISNTLENGKQRLTYQFEDAGAIYGPYVEDRPAEEMAADYLAGKASQLATSVAAPSLKQQLRGLLDGAVGQSTYDICARVLAEFGIRKMNISGTELTVTAEAVTPRDLPASDEAADQAIGAAIDEAQPGRYAAIKAVLKAAGFEGKINMQREAEVPL